MPIPTPLRNTPDPERSLRIGFLSPDFRQNVAASALELVIDGLDRGAGQVFGYANVAHPDAVTSRLQGKLDGYRNVWGWSSGLIADCIRADQIDILVVVGGHVAHHCLEVCLHRAAPVQVDFHGLCTTGLEQVDYRFTDELLDPPEQLGFYLERSVYLPGGWFCLRPPEVSPLVSPLPALTQGHVTFGSFNSYVKITDSVLDAWAAILTALPDSRLILKFHSGDDPILRQIFMDKFGTRGIREDRVEICGRRPYLAHLDLFHRVDLALDTYPFNGGMTTLEALWMGVPVLTLTGSTFLSRAGLSILSRLGLEAFSCRTQQEYVAKAVAISGQTDALAEIRRSLRGRLLASPLCHPRRIGSELEAAFRWMWRNWCDRRLAKRSRRNKLTF